MVVSSRNRLPTSFRGAHSASPESILPIVVMDSGLALRAPRNDGELWAACFSTHEIPSSPRLRARAVPLKTLFENRGRREGRVQVAPMVRVQKESTRQNHRYEPDIRPSLRDGFTAYSALSPGTGVLAPVASALRRSARLASASGGQDHTASPCASGCSSARTSHAATRHAHRSPPHARDDRDAPLLARWDVQGDSMNSGKAKVKNCDLDSRRERSR